MAKDLIRIQAIKDTIAIHKHATKLGVPYTNLRQANYGNECPLCAYSKKETGGDSVGIHSMCAACPWVLHSGHTCEDDVELMPEDTDGTLYTYTENKKSIERLERWLRLEE